jgi:sugar/nucleoside kinase (ribokinase family)
MARPDILCIGALHWDVIGRCAGRLGAGDDRPGRVLRRPGGVAFNIARALTAEGLRPALLAVLGRDAAGDALAAACVAAGVDPALALRADGATGSYVALEDADGLVAAVADATTLEAAGTALLAPLRDGRLPAPWTGPAVLDGNLPEGVLAAIAAEPVLAGARLSVAAASNAKAGRLAAFLGRPGATLYLNRAEAAELAGRPCADAAAAAAALARPAGARLLITDGAGLAAWVDSDGAILLAPPRVSARRVTGAGDRLVAAHLAAEARGLAAAAALSAALAAAAAHVAGEDPQ